MDGLVVKTDMVFDIEEVDVSGLIDVVKMFAAVVVVSSSCDLKEF